MKYSDKNKPTVCMMTQSTCYKGTRKFTPKGVLWHSTGANNPKLSRYVQPDDNAKNRAEMIALIGSNTYGNDWNHEEVQAGLNCWIGKLADGTVSTLQTMPWDYKPWGCGSGPKGSCNETHCQFEICEDGLTDKAYFDAAYKEACEITAYLCKLYGIDPNGTIQYNGVTVPTILCHADSHTLGLGSNHGDVLHWFKNFGKTMADVRKDVAALLKGDTSTTTVEKNGLTKGDTGSAVKTMQAMLIACGYSCGSSGADGDFGNNTLAGLKAFQKDAGLTVDGVYDKDSKAALEKKYKALTAEKAKSGLQATSLKGLSEADVVKKVGSLFAADQKKSGILASVSMAQFILESGYAQTDLAQGANNCFGMKKVLSNNTWTGSTWDGVSIYTKKTQEDDGTGKLYYITADFRKYPCVEDSVADHSAYLLGAKNGSKLRYAGLKGETDHKKAIQIIKDGGYATDTKYVSKICSIIERWNLTQYDLLVETSSTPEKQEAEIPSTPGEDKTNFRVIADRKINDITKANLSQIPAKRGSNKIEFIVLHYLGIPNADNPYLYGGGYGGHYNIKRDGSIYKAADPKTAVVWHCGGGLQGSGGHSFYKICGNYNSIGIECGVCYTDTSVKSASGDSGQWYFTAETQESLVWLVSKLMDEYGISIDHVIRHHDVTGKICPNPYVKNNRLRTSWTWDEFKTRLAQYRKTGGYSTDGTAEATEAKWYRVRKSWNDASSQVGAYLVLTNAKEECDKHPGYSVYDWNGKAVYAAAGAKFPYLVRISIDDLNIREKPTVNSKSHGYTGKGVYTITDEQDGWGLLKSYADKRNGWVKLSYTEKL